jgi:hypothetical protein
MTFRERQRWNSFWKHLPNFRAWGGLFASHSAAQSGRQVEMLLGYSDKGIVESSLVIPRDEAMQLSGAVNHGFLLVYGGDDGARTRDLCRDRAAL